MKMKEAFKKVETYNELAAITNERPKAIWFASILAAHVRDGGTFTDYGTFRKFIRREFFKSDAEQILNYDEFEFRGRFEIESLVTDGSLCFEVDLCDA